MSASEEITQLKAKAKNYQHLVGQLELRNRLLKEQNEVLLRANQDRAKVIESLQKTKCKLPKKS